MRVFWLLLLLLCLALPVQAQEATVVQVTAADGLVLTGDFYLVGPERATVILLHQLYTDRRSWQPYVRGLLDAGYNVLAVDVRGHGASRARQDWAKAVDDVALWFAWLRGTAGVRDSIATVGSSMGSTLALVGCARDATCRTAVAISPGWRYNGISVQDALTTQLAGRQAYLLYTRRDRFPALGVPRMVEAAPQSVVVQVFDGNRHGMDVLARFPEALPLILDWLATRTQ
ncbi:MAG: alpha/beta hydrolase [Anaerolineae bacterium]|jgi:pimeloyl-ACP methyl ester carboxylesterase|nr:alpha/beta hydrolase [Anaerolineae bacterium]